ncbi:MAG: response regulator, partial [Bradymonadaceae bacterium]
MKTILLLLDDPPLQNLYGRMLERRQYRVLHAGRADQARTLLEDDHIDLLIVDDALLDAAGFAFLSELGVHEPNRLKIVYLTPSFQQIPGRYEGALAAHGVDLILQKPLSPMEFGVQIDHLMESFDLDTLEEDSSATREFDAMRQDFVFSIPENIEALGDLFNRLLGDSNSAWLGESLDRRIARMRSAAMHFGFHELALLLRNLQDALVESATNGGGEAPSFEARLVETLDVARSIESTNRRTEMWRSEEESEMPTVLVIEEDADFLHTLEQFGEQFMIRVEVARDLTEALRYLRAHSVDGIFAGIPDDPSATVTADFLYHLRASAMPSTPVALICRPGDSLDHVQGVYAGAALILHRPLSASSFYQAAHHLFSLHKPDQTTILLVDDDESFADELCSTLRSQGIFVTHLPEATRLLAELERVRPNALLLNPTISGISGFDVCRMLRSIPRWQDLPILFVTNKPGVEPRIAAYQAGADDFLLRPIVSEDLIARLRVRLEQTRLLRDRADRDMLTGMLTRRAFLEQLSARLSEVSRHDRPLVFCILDIDHFKNVNDTYGHETGSGLLRVVGETIWKAVRVAD